MPLYIIHLSDIHVHNEDDSALEKIPLTADVVNANPAEYENIIILISGDLAFSGAESQYAALNKSLELLIEKLVTKGFDRSKIDVLMVPGNHDGEFKKSSKARGFTIDGVRREKAVDDETIDICTKPQEKYFEFEGAYISNKINTRVSEKLLKIYSINSKLGVIEFWCLNTSWMSVVPEQPGTLFFPIELLEKHLCESVHLRFAIIHHPLNWYIQENYHPLRELILKGFNGVFSGHEHSDGVRQVSDIINGESCLFFEAGALGPHSSSEPIEFNTLKILPQTGSYELENYIWNKDKFEINTSVSSEFNLKKNGLSLRRKFVEDLEDLSAPFFHHEKDELKLSDVYVELDFENLNGSINDNLNSDLDHDELLQQILECNYVVLKGEEQHGKSGLLNHLCRTLFIKNYFPIKINAARLSVNSIERWFDDQIKIQYETNDSNEYWSSGFSKRMVLIDDFDKITPSDVTYQKLLKYLKSKFSKIIFTVGDRYDISLLVSDSVVELYEDFSYFKIKGFSYLKRSELIKKWYGLSGGLDRSSYLRKVHAAQEHIDNSISKALIPSTAFNTLMLLQALETTQKSQVVDFGIAQHYDILIKTRLKEGGFSAIENDGVYSYLSNLAWWLNVREKRELTQSEIQEFNNHFILNIHSSDCTTLLRRLIECRLIKHDGVDYGFKYPSARYFFLSHYIAENFDTDDSVKDFALNACRKLYKKEYANLIVFLTGKTSSKKIVVAIIDVLKNLLNNISPFSVAFDVASVNEWVTSRATLAVTLPQNEEEATTKKRKAEERNDAQSQSDADPDVNDVVDLDPVSQMNLVFKTSEILGLILKSKFASFDMSLKNSILDGIINAPLRSISYFFSIIKENPDALVSILAKKIEEKSPGRTKQQCIELSRKFIFFALGNYCLALLSRQGEIIGSPNIMQYIDAYVSDRERNEIAMQDTLKVISSPDTKLKTESCSKTYKLIQVASDLSFPHSINERNIKNLAELFEKNLFAFNLLQGLVANYIYMFQLPIDARQRLAAMVNIEIKNQIVSDGMRSDSKKLVSRKFKYTNSTALMKKLTQRFISINRDIMDSVVDKKKSRKGLQKSTT